MFLNPAYNQCYNSDPVVTAVLDVRQFAAGIGGSILEDELQPLYFEKDTPSAKYSFLLIRPHLAENTESDP